MEDKIKLKLDYKKLLRSGKKLEAQKILKRIWAFNKPTKIVDTKKVEIKEESIEVKEIKKKINLNSLSDLHKINGIGGKTVKDIKIMFRDLESLKNALSNDAVALRDDIVEKLKEELI